MNAGRVDDELPAGVLLVRTDKQGAAVICDLQRVMRDRQQAIFRTLSDLYNCRAMPGQVGPAEREAVLLRELDHIERRLDELKRGDLSATSVPQDSG
jgi:hypothetical protein